MDEKLDLIDRKILYYLDSNSRAPYTIIAKKIKTSPQVVKYRIESLYKRGILLYCWPMIEYRAAGYFFNLYFIKLHNMNEQREKEFYDYVNNHGYIPIVMRGEGYADVILAICAKNIFHLNEIVKDLNTKFSDIFLEYTTATAIGFSRFNRNYLVDKHEFTKQTAYTGAEVEKINLDEIDRKILSMLNFNARVSIVDISKTLKSTVDIVRSRIKKLQKLGIIQCYTVLMDHVKAGFPRYRTVIKLVNLTGEREKEFVAYCNMHPNIIHHLKMLGAWDCLIDIEVDSRENLRRILMEIKYKFSDIIQRIEPTYIYHIDQFRDIPIEHPKISIGEKYQRPFLF